MSVHERVSEMPASKHICIHAMECSRSNLTLSDLEQSISKMPEQNAEEEHKVNEYEREEYSCHCLSNCIISSKREVGGRLLHQPNHDDWKHKTVSLLSMINNTRGR